MRGEIRTPGVGSARPLRPRIGVRGAALTLVAAALASACPPALGDPVDGRAVELRERVIRHFRGSDDPADRLAFRGGLVLSGPRGFGGYSGLLTEGDALLAASDVGHWLSARMRIEDGRLAGLSDVRLIPRRDAAGRPISSKREGDAEALARLPGGVMVAVEKGRALLSYRADGLAVDWDAPSRPLVMTAELRATARRRGIEALARLPDGTVIALAENGQDGAVAAFRGGDDGFDRARTFSIAAPDGYAVTGADALPGGDLVIVERRYRGGIDVSMRVRRIGADALARGGRVDGPVLLEAGFAAEIDNMEAVSAEVVDGRIVLTLLSDDNLSFWQRTLLLRFEVTDPLPRPNPRRRALDSGRS